jgi:hypothetical protein
MPLVFDALGLLAPGVHDATVKEVEDALCKMGATDRRYKLGWKLFGYLGALAKSGLNAGVILDGSFVMSVVEQPDDIDGILVLPADWDFTASLPPSKYNLIARRQTRKDYEIELWAVAAGSPDEARWIDFFGQVRIEWCQQFGWPADVRKGLVRIVP